MKIWITGIAGFLGSHLAEALLTNGHFIDGNDNFLCGEIKNIPHSNIGCSIIRNGENPHGDNSLDCRDYEAMLAGFELSKPDVLIHCAATAHEGLSSFSPSFITKNIYEASVSTFSAAIAAGVRRIVFMSSMARYGDGHKQKDPTLRGPPFYECDIPSPVDPYGIAKVAAEDTLKILAKTHGVEYVIAVPHNIIGPRQKYDDPMRNVCSIMINRALKGQDLIVYGDGSQKRCFSPIKDCLSSLVKMIDAPLNGETINIGPDEGEITILELANIVISECNKYTSKKVGIIHMPDRPNEVKEAYCSSEKARKLLDYKPQQSIHDCITEMVSYIHEHGTKEFAYTFPIEIVNGCPKTWVDKLI